MDPSELLPGARRIAIRARALADSMRRGAYRSAFRGRGMEFEEVREYAWGDDPRSVDWNVSARLGRLQVKRYREERELEVLLVLDRSASMRGGAAGAKRMETAAATAALLAFAAEANGDRVGAIIFGGPGRYIVPPRRGTRHAMALVEQFLSLKAAGRGSDIAGALRAARFMPRKKCVCVVISDFLADGWKEELAALGAAQDLIAVMVRDPAERGFPRTGLLELEDPETGERLLAPGRSRRFREAWKAWNEDRAAKARSDCAARGVDFLELQCGADPAGPLIDFFKRRRAPS